MRSRHMPIRHVDKAKRLTLRLVATAAMALAAVIAVPGAARAEPFECYEAFDTWVTGASAFWERCEDLGGEVDIWPHAVGVFLSDSARSDAKCARAYVREFILTGWYERLFGTVCAGGSDFFYANDVDLDEDRVQVRVCAGYATCSSWRAINY